MSFIKARYFKTEINLQIFLFMLIAQTLGVYGFYLAINCLTNWKTIIFHFALGYTSLLGSMIGAHRYWSHKSFEPNIYLKIILLFLQTYSAQTSAYQWARDHRVHHKYVDTDADPYNIHRGMFFSQMGWLALRKTKEFKEKDLADLTSDPLVMFQYRHFEKLLFLVWAISAFIPCALFNESLLRSACTLCLSMVVCGHHNGTINSLSHSWGWKPYDTGIEPTLSRLVVYLTLGEGYHNFHHTFPKDYSQSELKWSQTLNISALLIDLGEYLGLITNKKVAPPELIARRRARTGDLSVEISPRSAIIDYILGLIIFLWAIWLIFGLRYYKSFES